MKDNKILEGLESIDRIKLLIGYSLDKTLNENKEHIINEQVTNIAINIGLKLINALSGFFDDDEEEALRQIKRVDSKEILDALNKYIKEKKGLSLIDYLNDEMSDIDSEYKSIFNHLTIYDPSYKKGYKGEGSLIKRVGGVMDSLSKNTPTLISAPKSLTVTGPYRIEDNVIWNKEIMTYSEGGETTGYFIIKNNSKEKLSITGAKSNYEEGKVSYNYFTTPINPGGETKVFVTVKSKVVKTPNITARPDNRIAVDNTYVAPKVNPKSFEKPKLNIPQENNVLIIYTNLGEIKLKLKFDYNQATKAQMAALKNWENGLSIPGGYRVLQGISPFEYDEFLNKVKTLSNESGCKSSIGDVYNKLTKGDETLLGDYINEQSVIGAPNYGTITSTDDEKTRWACQNKLKEIFNQYSNRKFPKGITKDDLKDFNSQKETINKEILAWQNSHKKSHKAKYWTDEFGVREKIQDEGYYFDEKLLSASEKKEYEELKKKIENLEQYYGYDGRSEFDKFMDSGWGQLAQFGAIAALVIAGFFTEGATWIVAADLLLNLSIGAYYAGRGNTREALMYFIFAGMGQLHSLYNMINNGLKTVGYRGIQLTTVSKSIASKMAGLTFDSPQALNSFMYGVLNDSERAVFRETLRTLKTQPKVVQESLEGLSKEVAQARGVYKNLSWVEAQKMSKFMGTKKFASNMFIDLMITIPKVQEMYDFLKSEFNKKGIDITWGERDHKILDYLAQNMPASEIKKLGEVMLSILEKLTKEEAKYYEAEVNKMKEEQILKHSQMTQSEINSRVKKYKDLREKKRKSLELEKQKIADTQKRAQEKMKALLPPGEDWQKIAPHLVGNFTSKNCRVEKDDKGIYYVQKSTCNSITTTTTTIK